MKPSETSVAIKFFAFLAAVSSTAIAAFVVFVGGPVAWDLIKAFASEFDWKSATLIAFLIAYFFAAWGIWKDEFARLKALSPKRSMVQIPGVVVKGLVGPAVATIFGLYELLSFLTVALLANVIHNSAGKILVRSVGVLTLIWLSIFTILIASNLWQPPENHCAWKFPKVLTCLLTKNDGLAGGIIGAGGTIFAGWLAWLAVHEQINQNRNENLVGGNRKVRRRDED